MPSSTIQTALALRLNTRFFFGWAIVVVGAIGIFASGPGQSHIFSVYFPYIAEELNLTRGEVSTAYGAATLVVSFLLPLIGKQVDRRGARPVLLAVTLCFGLVVCLFSQVQSLLVLAIAFAALRFLGQGSLMLCSNNMVSQWFSRSRGFALSMLSWGFAASMALHPKIALWLSETVGWRESWIWLGIMTWVLVLPAVYFFAHSKPEDLSLRPDGDDHTDTDAAAQVALTGHTLKEARATRTFWIVIASLMSLSGLVTALFLYQVDIFTRNGLSAELATTMLSITAITMVVSVPMIGRVLDRFRPERIFAVALAVMSAALMLATQVVGLKSAIIYAIVFGLANAAIHAHYVFLWAYYFGRKHLGSIQGFAQSLIVVGASIAPIPFGLVFDRTGSYNDALWYGAIVPVVCALFVLTLKRPPTM